MNNKEFLDWLKEQVSDIKIEPTKEEMSEMMINFAGEILKAKDELDNTFGMKVPNEMFLSILRKSIRENGK